MDGNQILLLGIGVQHPWELVDQRLDTDKQPHRPLQRLDYRLAQPQFVATIRRMEPHTATSTDVSVRELKNSLSEYLRRVRCGEEIHVTLRGKRIARLLPEPTKPSTDLEDAVARLEAMPWLQPSKHTGRPLGAARPLRSEISTEELVRWLRD